MAAGFPLYNGLYRLCLSYLKHPSTITSMSAEFVSEYNETAICAAVGFMEGNMRSFDYVGEYIQDLQDIYSKYPDGDVEIMRMIRAAQLISNRRAGDMGEEVQAVYHGELLGLELINNLEPHVGKFFKTGYAQSFMKFNLEKDKPRSPEEAMTNLLANDQERLYQLAQSLQIDLSFPIYQHDLNPIYEEFGKNATSKLYDESQHQDLAMIGFRMIVIEALKPAGTNEANELLDRIPTPVGLAPQPPVSIADIARNMGAAKETSDEQGAANFMNWQDISNIPDILHKKLLKLTAPEQDAAFSDKLTLAEIDRHIEQGLMKYATDNELLGSNDILSFQGEFYSIASDEKGFSLYDRSTEIQGDFDSIQIVDVPTNSQMLEDLNKDIDADEEADDLMCAIAIRISNPVFIITTTEGEPVIEPTEEETIDIPLNYEDITIKRIKAKELEIEA